MSHKAILAGAGDWGDMRSFRQANRWAALLLIVAMASTVLNASPAQAQAGDVVLTENFDTGAGSFSYADDTFRSSALPFYASGSWAGDLGFNGGGVEVVLGGIDGADVYAMSGGWSSAFTLTEAAIVTVSLRYDLRQRGTEEADERGQALVAVDGQLVGVPPNDWIDQVQGDGNAGPAISTGWQEVALSVGELAAGTHTITLGGFFSKKTFFNEATTVAFDDLIVSAEPIGPPSNLPPVAVPTATAGNENPLSVAFDGTASIDPDGSIEAYDWAFGDGQGAAGATVSHVYEAAGDYTAVLTVTDNEGAVAASSIEVTVVAPPDEVGLQAEAGIVAQVGDAWQTVSLGNVYQSPVVVATVQIDDGSQDPVVARVRNAGASSFDVRLQTTTGVNAASFDVQFFVVEEGIYTEAVHGVTMEAVRTNSTITARAGSWTREPRSFVNSYVNPVVLGQVMTANDPAWSVFWASAATTRTAPPAAGNFAAGKHVGEDPLSTRADETIGYIVIESGAGQFGGLTFQTGVGTDLVRGVDNTTSGFDYPLSGGGSPFSAVVSSAGMDGVNGGWPVLYGFAPVDLDRLTVVIDEDIAGDSERSHTTEQVAYLVLGASF